MAGTLATIRTLAQIHADQDAGDFPTPAQYNILINAAVNHVWIDLFVAGYPINFSTVTIAPNGGTQYALGVANVATVTGVFFQLAGERYELKKLNEGFRSQLESATGVIGFASYYDVRVDPTLGIIVELLPKPTSGTYTVNYIPGFAGFVSDSDPWFGPIGSDELIAIKAAIKACGKEGEARLPFINQKMKEYQELLTSITNMTTWVDQRNGSFIRDVSTLRNRYSFDYPVAGFSGDLYG